MVNLSASIDSKKIPPRTINDVSVHRSVDNDRIVEGEAVNESDRTIIKEIFSHNEGDFVEYEFQDKHGRDHGSAKIKSIELDEESADDFVRIKYKMIISKV